MPRSAAVGQSRTVARDKASQSQLPPTHGSLERLAHGQQPDHCAQNKPRGIKQTPGSAGHKLISLEISEFRKKGPGTCEESAHTTNEAGCNIEKTDLNLNSDHGMDATSKTMVIINDNILSIRGKKVTLDLGVYSKPSIFYLNDKIYVSVTDIQNQKTYLFDSQAVPIENFPIYGSSTIDMADIDNDKRPELVVKDQENSLTVFKIN